MKLLFDENMPVGAQKLFEGHECDHVLRLGFAGINNGELVTQAEEFGFKVLVTLDKDIKGEQNLKGRSISILVLRPRGQGLRAVSVLIPQALIALKSICPGDVLEIS